MPAAVAVSSTVPFPITIAALPRGMAWVAHPTWAPPAMKATSMLLTVTSPGTPACGARAWPTWRVVRTYTSAATEPGRLTQVEQPDATTDGAAGGTGVPAAAGGRLWAAVSGPVWHPARLATAIAAIMLATRLIRLLPPGPGPGPGDLGTASSRRILAGSFISMTCAACLVSSPLRSHAAGRRVRRNRGGPGGPARSRPLRAACWVPCADGPDRSG